MAKVIFSKRPHREQNGYQEDYGSGKDYDGEYSDDDDVFVADPILDVASATKPLMHPRQRARVKSRRPDCKCRLLFRPVLYFLFLVASLGGLMLLILYMVNRYEDNGLFASRPTGDASSEKINVIGCDKIDVEDVWVIGIPKLLTESAFRMVDVNKDGVLDVVLGFATGADGYGIPDIVCDVYFNGTYPCFGGLLALEGRTGKELWRHYSKHEIFAVICNADLNDDGVLDCLGAGRAGVFQAVSGKDGELLWNFGEQKSKNNIMNVYTPVMVSDIDQDGVVDFLVAHGGDPLQEPGSDYRLSGRLLLFSGRTGKVLIWTGTPDKRETYYSPQVYRQVDGTQIVLFGTGGETHPGALWRIPLNHLVKGDIEKAVAIYRDGFKGIMTPPVLVDITKDGVVDIIISIFNSSTLAYDGRTYKLLWNYTVPQSESYNTPGVGYFNDDDTPDFMVKFSHGPGFPVYYHSETNVLDGKTGVPILDRPVRDTVGSQSSPLTVSMEGRGNDVFIYWVADCKGHEGGGEEFSFVDGTNVHEKSRSDFCKLRYKSNGFTKAFAVNSHITIPGAQLYFSEERTSTEHSVWVNTTEEARAYLNAHPNIVEAYENPSTGQQVEEKEKETGYKFKPSKEFISPEAHYRNEYTSSGKKGPPLLVGHGHKEGRKEVNHNQPNRPKGDNKLYGKLNVAGRTVGQNQGRTNVDYQRGRKQLPYGGRYGNYPAQNKPSRNPSGQSLTGQYRGDQYELPYDLTPDSTFPGYYPSRSNDYEDDDYPRYRISQKRSSPDTKFHFMRRKRDVDDVESFLSLRRLKDLKARLLEEETRRDAGYGRLDGLYMKRRKRDAGRKKRGAHRKQRHVGPHDGDGLQRLISTGTLAPSTLDPKHPDYNYTVEYVFATYWFYPAKTQTILPADQKCISTRMSKEDIRFDPKSKYYGLDHDNYERAITQECLEKSDHQLPDDGVYESQTEYDPFNVHMGQMTLYRLRIKCTCSDEKMKSQETKSKRCSRVLPFDQQTWPAYMGRKGDSHWGR